MEAIKVKPVPRVIGAFSDNPTYDELQHRLAELAAAWRIESPISLFLQQKLLRS